MISPGSLMPWSASKAFISTALCCALWKGSPRGCPKGHFRKIVLGGFTFSVNFLTREMPIVGIPAFSISLCISPTD